MDLCATLALLLLSSLYFTYGEQAIKQQNNEHGGKTRGEMLAVETNSELISSSPITPGMELAPKCSQDGTTCLSCRSVGMCKNGVLTEVPCRGLYPYCDARTGTCTSERKRCQGNDKPMSCPQKGFYPDPQSCRSFYVCEDDPKMSYKFSCSSLQVYDHEEKKCVRPSFRVRCTSFSCFGKQGRYTAYPADRSIYTLCSDATGIGMFKCHENTEFDETKQKCVPSCSSENNMVDVDDDTCKKYYRCVKSGSKFEAIPSSCPGQRVFDPTELKCIPKKPSFKCTQASAESNPPPSLPANPPSGNKEDIIGQSEDTFFRDSHLEEKPTNENVAATAGSPLNKDSTSTQKNLNAANSNILQSEISLEKKTTGKEVPSSYDNVAAVISMVAGKAQVTDSKSPSKVVVSETGSTLLHASHTSTAINEQTSSTSYPPTREEIKSTEPTIKTSMNNNLNHLTQASTPYQTTDRTLLLNTLPPLKSQTYKVITSKLEAPSSTIEPASTPHATSSPSGNNHDDHFIKQSYVTSEMKDKIENSKAPLEQQPSASTPTQVFNTNNSEKTKNLL